MNKRQRQIVAMDASLAFATGGWHKEVSNSFVSYLYLFFVLLFVFSLTSYLSLSIET